MWWVVSTEPIYDPDGLLECGLLLGETSFSGVGV